MNLNPIRRSILKLFALSCVLTTSARGGDLVLTLGGSDAVATAGALRRWDDDGNPRVPVDAKARIDQPRVDAKAVREQNGRWVFRGLPPGRYDLVVITSTKVRVEGFHYPPIKEFDPFWPADAPEPEADTRAWIVGDIAKSRHYENKVSPLFLAGDEKGKEVRVFMQLARDEPTSFDGEFGARAATIRHEVWQYTNRYGGWVKDRSTRVFDRVLMAGPELAKWTWAWEPKLGGIVVADAPVAVAFTLPARFDAKTMRGWVPK